MKSISFSFGRVVRGFGAFVVFLSAAVFLSACKTPDDEIVLPAGIEELSPDSPLIGTWQDSFTSSNSYENYDMQIATTFIETASYGRHDGIIYIGKINESSGYIYYQLSSDIQGYGSAPLYTPYTVECKGKWSAVAYSNLTASSVKTCDAYNSNSPYDFPNTLEECVKKYTNENGYYSQVEFLKCPK